MRWTRALFLVSIMLFSHFLLIPLPSAKADEGHATVYIICLSDVPTRNFDGQESHTSKIRVKEGAVRAIEFLELYSLPSVHPKLGKDPPYYGISYAVITEWSVYKFVIESYDDVILINTHGEILPIPSGYDPVSWMDKIASGMLNRRLTWVHTGGYPFYYVWHQGAAHLEEWPSNGMYGFKNFTQYININNATCNPPYSETDPVYLNEHAEYNLRFRWSLDGAFKVECGKPLKASDFRNYNVLTIWGTEDDYMTGAVIAFVKPSERMLPADCRGFGAYVHIGTRKTFTAYGEETDGDYYRGYVGAAAAIWTETLTFNQSVAAEEYIDNWGYRAWGLTVTPVMTHYSCDETINEFMVRLSFGIHGFLKTNATWASFGNIEFYLEAPEEECIVMASSSISKNLHNIGRPSVLIDIPSDVKFLINAARFFVSVSGILSGTGVVYTILKAIHHGVGGFMLFSDFVKLDNNRITNENGVDEIFEPNHYVMFTYEPETYTTQPGDGYIYREFQSIIFTEFRINITYLEYWRVIPTQWRLKIRDTTSQIVLTLNGDCSIALFRSFNEDNYSGTVFFEDFGDSDGNLRWYTEDTDPRAGYDYWGIVRTTPGRTAFCGAIGTNSIYGEQPNIERGWYDKYMNAIMERPIDLRPYRTVILRYNLFYRICPGDYLALEYFTLGSWIAADTVSGDGIIDHWREVQIPTTAEKIRFRFYSNGDDNVLWGAYINHIEIIAWMPNDANTNADAGDNFNYATYITHPNSYGAYLNNPDEDWYKFNVTPEDITSQKTIYISIEKPPYTTIKMELYEPNNQTIGSTNSNSLIYSLRTTDTPGQWRLRIYPIMGFGAYAFRIQFTPLGGGGGCPILLVWNGSTTVDYGAINIHNSEGQDIIREISILKGDLSIQNQIAKLRLKEGWEGLIYSHSKIDQVKLYAIDIYGNRHLCPLISAIHSEQGNVILRLLFSDDWRTDAYLKETIDLQFIMPYPIQIIQSYLFVIEGHNPEKIWE